MEDSYSVVKGGMGRQVYVVWVIVDFLELRNLLSLVEPIGAIIMVIHTVFILLYCKVGPFGDRYLIMVIYPPIRHRVLLSILFLSGGYLSFLKLVDSIIVLDHWSFFGVNSWVPSLMNLRLEGAVK